jgi:hypothetical protein
MRCSFDHCAAVCVVLALMSPAGVVAAAKPYEGGNYKQDFAALPHDGNSTNNLGEGAFAVPAQPSLPNARQFRSGDYQKLAGWYFGTPNATTGFAVSDGDRGGGNNNFHVFSFGSREGHRALGVNSPNERDAIIGVVLRNDTGGTLTRFTVAYRGEQWRVGRFRDGGTMRFSYSVADSDDPAGLLAADGVEVSDLNFQAIHAAAEENSALDGEDPDNQRQFTATIQGVEWPAGGYLWLRWQMHSRNNTAGLGIGELTFEAHE